MIYLDNAATTRMSPEVLDAMMPYLTDEFGNPGSIHQYGKRARNAVDNARELVASFMGCEPEQVIFTSGGSEGNNLVFAGIAKELLKRGRTEILVSSTEHDSVRKSALKLAEDSEFKLRWIPPDRDGVISLVNACSDTGLVSVMSANNETGVLNPVFGICKSVHREDALFHTDAVQAAGMYPLKAVENEFDFMTISSHKIHGPKGVGALFVRDPELLTPIICGGAEQEFGLRGGTENVAGIVGFGAACEQMALTQEARKEKRERISNKFLLSMIEAGGNMEWFSVNGYPPRDFKTINILFDGVDAESLVLLLSDFGVCVSAGSACREHENEPSHVLTAMGIEPEKARNSIRVSFTEDILLEQVESAAKTIAKCVNIIRGVHT